MKARQLAVPGCYEFTPRTFGDQRGVFVAPFQESAFLDTVGHPMRLGQTNHSRSRRGSVRGVHFAEVPPGQSKYVYCPIGALLDIVVDIRLGSPTFGVSDAVLLDPVDFRAVYVAEGVGHAIVALTDDTVISYLCSAEYNPTAEHGIHPLDPELNLPWPADLTPVLSDKDAAAPTLAEATAAGLLPTWSDCVAWYDKLASSRL